MRAADYIRHLQQYEAYGFSWEELVDHCNASVATLRKELQRLIARGEIINLRKGYYIIMPPRYQQFGKLPVELYIDKLFSYLGKSYYLAFYSAAAFHGATHQATHTDYVMTQPPAMLEVEKEKFRIRFFKTTRWPANNIERRQSDAGYFYLSSPFLTVVDLVYHQASLGGMHRIVTVIEELVDSISKSDVEALLEWYPHKSVLQRAGFILDELHADKKVTGPLVAHLQEVGFYPVLLKPQQGQKPGRADNKWKVDVNLELKSDLSV